MQLSVIQRVLGLLLMIFSLSMLPPALVGWHYGDGEILPFIQGFCWLFALGALIYWPVRNFKKELKLRDGFLIVVLFWTVLSLSGAVPLYLAETPAMSLTDAVFEAVSGLTTTGATVLTGLDTLPHSILFYRQELQWLGGMGIVVLAVAILPLLGIGGLQLFKAETPGPMKDNKLTARIADTAKTLWFIYVGLTIAATLAYRFGGMSWFDAVGHAFSTVSIGGFSTHDAGFGFYNSVWLEYMAALFMFLAGVNFTLHFAAWARRSWRNYAHDSEFRAYATILLSMILLYTLVLWSSNTYESLSDALRYAVFNVVSYATTTGFATADITLWPVFLPTLLIFLALIGGSTGSAAGGMKVMRVVLILKQSFRELRQLIHPQAELLVKLNEHVVPTRVIQAVWGFFSAYIVILLLLMLFMQAVGLDEVSAFGAAAATLSNLGPGLGDVSSTFASAPDAAKWVGCLAMILGRLEIFTLLVLFTPAFWRR
ncbi:MAG: TrkH family potassium uptake protein [Halothiobacillaceae bacterium]|nr:TrkH family potassium uptake protein [Halothiobacillaceae bacterium]